MINLDDVSDWFYQAYKHKEWAGEDSTVRNISISQAYKVQEKVALLRTLEGETEVGYKVGCTSAAIRKHFGLTEPIYGRLFQPGTTLNATQPHDWSTYVKCAIEPEMVFKIGKDLVGKNLSDDELVDSVAFVSPGIELHEFTFWVQPPTIQELICSGSIHTGLVIGDEKVLPEKLDFKNELFSVYKDDLMVTSGKASEIMGGPLHSMRWLVNSLTNQGKKLKAGS